MEGSIDIVDILRKEEKEGKLTTKSTYSSVHTINPEDETEQDPDYSILRNNKNEILNSQEFHEDFHKENDFFAKSSVTINELVFQNTSDLMVFLDKRGRIVKINNTALTYFGFQRDEIIGKPFWKIPGVFSKDNITSYIKVFKKTLHGNQTKDFVNELKDKSGSRHIINFSTFPLKQQDKINHIIVIGKDITDEQKNKEKIIEYQERYRSLFEDSQDWVYLCDFKGNFLDANNAALNGMGYHRSEINNLNFKDIVNKDQYYQAFKILKNLKDTYKQNDITEYKIKRKNGEIAYVESMASVIFRNKKPYAIQGIVRDITDRKKAEEEQKEYIRQIKLITDLFITSSRKDSVEEICELIAKSVHELIPYSYVGVSLYDPLTQEIRIRSLTGDHKRIEQIIKLVGGDFSKYSFNPDEMGELSSLYTSGKLEEIPEGLYGLLKQKLPTSVCKTIEKILHIEKILTIGFALDQKPYGGISILLKKQDDISNYTFALETIASHFSVILHKKQADIMLHQAHEKLKELNLDLEHKVDERTRQIKHLLHQKDEFINQLGHDLKNPLGPFMQLLPILKNHVSDEKDKQMVKVLDRNANYMRNLVKKTIDLAKLNSSKTKFTFEQVNLSSIINEVVSANSPLFNEQRINVINDVPSSLSVRADRFHLQEVFTNLFNNAIKYTEGPGKITISAKPMKDETIISVTDTGIGLENNQLALLFDEYYKADPSRHDFDSSGLGLPICKRIIERHGGCIWAESPGIGKGSTFYFTLPKKTIS